MLLFLGSTFVGLVFFSTFTGVSLTIKYNGKHPRQEVKEFAKKVNYVAFRPEKIATNDDFFTIKEKLFIKNVLKEDLNLNDFLAFYGNDEKTGQLVKIPSEGNSNLISFEFVEIKFDDVNQNFTVAFRARQMQKNGEFAYSDLFLQPISFYKEAKFLAADFSFALEKLTKSITENILDLQPIVTNFANNNPKPRANKLVRSIDFAQEINSATTSNEVVEKIGEFLPELKDLISKIQNSNDNKIPTENSPIFNFDFVKDKASQQFTVIQNEIPSLFIKAKLTPVATKMLENQKKDLANRIFTINLQTKENSSPFISVDKFFQEIKLKPLKYVTEETKNSQKTPIASQNPFDFFAKIKSASFLTKKEYSVYLEKMINSVLVENLSLDFGKFSALIPKNQNAVSFEFDPQGAKLNAENDIYTIEIPYKISLSESLFNFKIENTKIIQEKQLFLQLKGFMPTAKIIQNQEKNGNNLLIPGTQKTLIYTKPLLSNIENKGFDNFVSTFGYPLNAKMPFVKKELEELLAKQNFQKIQEKLSSSTGYNYNFDDFEAKIRSWVGKTNLPKISQFAKFEKEEKTVDFSENENDKKLQIATLNSPVFFKNPSDVAAFFAILVKKQPHEVAKTLFLLAKASGLFKNNRSLLSIFENNQADIFQIASKIRVDNKKIQVLSINDQHLDVYNQGFFSTLFLPKSIKDEIGDKIQTLSDTEIIKLLQQKRIFTDTKVNFSRAQIENDYKNATQFLNLADILLAFYLKAAQLDNFLAWSSIDSNMDYKIVFEKGGEISKSRFESEIKKATNPTVTEEVPLNSSENSNQNNEFLTLNFYYKIGKIGNNNSLTYFYQSPAKKILINFTNKEKDENLQLKRKLDAAISQIPSNFTNFQLEDGKFKEIIEKFEKSTQTQNQPEVTKSSDFQAFFGQNLPNIEKIETYFSEFFKERTVKFFIQPAFENSLSEFKKSFLVNVAIELKTQNSTANNVSGGSANQQTDKENLIFANYKFKITIEKIAKKDN
ncbi:P97 family adhesin [Mycoplasma sp. 'Moose RK']|uniref:P97 family adhesin n=1 Tax=Mycoplasma sp. 'Moose RK' TaxID=2780095 RepID=UPI0018C35168|nr:hypothetical protein [Mycoplasma sp. 'Moose RK']MBG0730734.1 hypothetical protein [Mycoplasma sp. 'Moose RK']